MTRGAALRVLTVSGALCLALAAVGGASAAGRPQARDPEAKDSGSQPHAPASQHAHGFDEGEDHEPLNPDAMDTMGEMEPTDRWMTMLHGYAFLNSNRQGGRSGDRSFESQNHVMVITMRRWAGGKLSLLGTFTLEAVTVRPEGSPQLFQRGETYKGVLLVDLQHPHDLFVQLGASWEKNVTPRTKLRFYIAPVGEPAVGPTAFPHRLSASEDPTAPLAHHNQDSTHISGDVVTVGLTASIVTLEGSAFHGREPDENRFDIDQGAIDSYSARLWVRPAPGLSVQVSGCRREHPEDLEEGNQTRQTASVEYERSSSGGFIAAALVLGRNKLADGIEWGNTLEATWKFARKNFVYGRIESVDRDRFELLNKQQRPESVPPERVAVQAATLGYVRSVPLLTEAETGLGADLTFYRFGSSLDPAYGTSPVSVHAFMRLRFGSHGAAGHEHMHM